MMIYHSVILGFFLLFPIFLSCIMYKRKQDRTKRNLNATSTTYKRREEKMEGKEKNSGEKMERKETSGEENIISSLSDDILLHIMSFLDMKHAVQTTILSKRWRNLWTSLGSLTFDSQLFYAPTTNQCVGFNNLVDQVLILRDNSNVKRFHLINFCRDFKISTRLINTWITYVVRRRVRELIIDVLNDGLRLPNCLFTCNSLTRMRLSLGGSERWSIPLPDSMCLPNLWELELYAVCFHDENLTNKFFLGCPNLIRLLLNDVEFLHMNVSISALKLHDLTVKNDGQEYGYCRWLDSKLELYAPNLKWFRCRDIMSNYYILKSSFPINAYIDMKVEEQEKNPWIYLQLPAEKKQRYGQQMMKFLRQFHNVQNLKLSHWFLEVVSGDPELLGSLTSKFCNLKHLGLKIWLSRDNINALTYLLKISPIMESLLLEISKIELSSANIEDYLEEGLSTDFSLDHLKFVEIQGLLGSAIELSFLKTLLKNAMTMETLVVFTSKEDSSPDRKRQLMKFSGNLLAFPRASASIGILFF